MQSITLIAPDDWHCHLRDGVYLTRTVPDTALQFTRSVIMPNLKPPVTSTNVARHYYEQILNNAPSHLSFQPLMTLYLTETMTKQTLIEAKKSGIILGCKLYPAGATTHSDAGVRDIHRIYPLFETMQDENLLLLIHGESIHPSTDIFDREREFIDQTLAPLLKAFPKLKIVLEHISSEYAADFVKQGPDNLAATITPHHLLINRNDVLVGGIKPHYYCLPIAKRSSDQAALINAAISGSPKFFLGTDSAPHSKSSKESACGCAGIYSAHAAIELYAEVFDQHHALDKLEGFASIHGANFYDLPINDTKITLEKKPWTVPEELEFGDKTIVPFFAGKQLNWKLKHL